MLTTQVAFRASVIALFLGLSTPVAAADVTEFDPHVIRDYVAGFDVSELSKTAKSRAMQIAHDPGIEHFDKVLMLHSLLKEQNALRHVPMHRVSPTYAGLGTRDAGA